MRIRNIKNGTERTDNGYEKSTYRYIRGISADIRDKDLEVRTLRSAVTVPVENQADTHPVTAPKVASRDRADPSRAGPSRSRVRPDQSSSARHHPYAGHWCSSDGRDVSVRRADRGHPSND
uniref:Transposase n=1 Tax=Globodera pallida TaxID=36090 RepID=A0A183CDA1_GLOPA